MAGPQGGLRQAVHVTTPLTSAPDGSLYFGFTVTGATPAHLSSGIARIDAHGHGTRITAAAAAGISTVDGVALNCAPALSPSGTTVYITVTSPHARSWSDSTPPR